MTTPTRIFVAALLGSSLFACKRTEPPPTAPAPIPARAAPSTVASPDAGHPGDEGPRVRPGSFEFPELDVRAVKAAVSGITKVTPRGWTTDGNYFLYELRASDRGEGGRPGALELAVVVDATSGARKRFVLSNGGKAELAAWRRSFPLAPLRTGLRSPSGHVSLRAYLERELILTIAAEGPATALWQFQLLTPIGPLTLDVAWSPDGKRFAALIHTKEFTSFEDAAFVIVGGDGTAQKVAPKE